MTILDEFRRDEVRVLDRLVDGELCTVERRELLAALDDEPGAWRRCGLAFLEAQTWRGQLTQLAAEPHAVLASDSPIQPATVHAVKRTRHAASRTRFLGASLAIAAGLLVAFALGTRFPAAGRLPVAGTVSDAGTSPIAGNATPERPDGGTTDPEAEAAWAQLDPDAVDESPWETITLARSAEAGAQEFQLSVVKDGASDQDWASAERSEIPAELVDQLERDGLKVTRERRLWPLELADGRR